MKKIFLIIVTLVIGASLYAGEVNTNITAAYNYGVFTEKADGIKTKTSCNGFDLSISCCFTENWGFYLNTDYNFSTEATVTSGGTSVTTTDSDWDFSWFLSVIIGPTYKYKINEKFEIFVAAGFHIAQYLLKSKYIGVQNYSTGIGGDLGFRYLPTEHFYITSGCLLSHDFKCDGEIYINGSTTKKSGSYNLGSVRPYIGIGFCFAEIIK